MAIGNVLLIVVLAVLIIGRRFAGRAVDQRRSLIIPLVLGVYGFSLLSKATPISTKDVTWLVVAGVVAVVSGCIRGTSIHLYEKDGVLWSRYTPMTAFWWVASIAARLGVDAVAVSSGAHSKAMTSSLAMMFGISLAAEAAIVLPRAWSSGVRLAVRS